MKVLVGATAMDTGRFTAFTIALNSLRLPTVWGMGSDFSGNCNTLVRMFLETEADALWIIGDDHSFESDIVDRLAARDVDIVVPLCLKRQMPFQPVIYAGRDGDELIPVDLHQAPSHGLISIYGAGSAGMLVKRHVLEAMEDPWFEHDPVVYE